MIDLSAFALMRIVAPENEAEPAPARVYCHLAGVTNLAVGVGNTCVFTRPLATDPEPVHDARGRRGCGLVRARPAHQ